MAQTQKEKRLCELNQKALDIFISNNDFDPKDWLDEKEAQEWQKLFDESFGEKR